MGWDETFLSPFQKRKASSTVPVAVPQCDMHVIWFILFLAFSLIWFKIIFFSLFFFFFLYIFLFYPFHSHLESFTDSLYELSLCLLQNSILSFSFFLCLFCQRWCRENECMVQGCFIIMRPVSFFFFFFLGLCILWWNSFFSSVIPVRKKKTSICWFSSYLWWHFTFCPFWTLSWNASCFIFQEGSDWHLFLLISYQKPYFRRRSSTFLIYNSSQGYEST